MRKILIAVLLILASNPAMASKIELLVKAVAVQETGYVDNCGEGCVPWDAWNVYTVKVRKVLKGEFAEKKIKVAVLEHAMRKLKYRRNWKIEISEFTGKETIKSFGTKYFVLKQIEDEKKDT